MPIYEYQCQTCGNHTEILQKVSDAPATTCPHCHQESLQKKISATAFHLKGNGWYVTDFKGKKDNTSQSKETISQCTTPSSTTKETASTAE